MIDGWCVARVAENNAAVLAADGARARSLTLHPVTCPNALNDCSRTCMVTEGWRRFTISTRRCWSSGLFWG